jgi:hypothetical protein
MTPFYVFMGLSSLFGLAGIWHAGNHRPRTGPAFVAGIFLGVSMAFFASVWLSLAIRALENTQQ